MGGFFILSQLANLCFMTYTYGEWTVDHWFACIVVGIVLVSPELPQSNPSAFSGVMKASA